MLSFCLLGLLLPAVRLVSAQCNEIPGLGGYPSPGEIVYIPPTATCTFAEVVEAEGNCPTYTDTATLIDPTGGQYVTTATLPDDVLVTVQYPVPTPAGLMPEGVYTLSDFITPPGAAFFAVFTLTHEPVIVTTDSTSTIVTSTTSFTTTTTTTTDDFSSTFTPVPNVVTNTGFTSTTLAPATITSTSTITPKPETKTKYSFTKVTKTITCCHFNHPQPQQVPIGSRGKGNSKVRRDISYPRLNRLFARDSDIHGLEKRADDPCVPQSYSLRPTATVYTNTVFSTSTVTFTSTETDSSTISTTFVATLPTQTTTTSITNLVIITPSPKIVFTKTRLPRVTTTTTKTITVTVSVRGPGYLHEC